MHHRSASLFAFATTLALLGSSASAAVVTAVGSQLTLGDRVRSTSLVKTLDLDGDNTYGTAGYEYFAVGGGNVEGPGFETNALISLPSYIADIASVPSGLNAYAAYTGYANIDNPALPVGPTIADVVSGFAYRGSTTDGVEYPLFAIQIASNISRFRVGFIVNQEFAFQQFPSNFRLQSGPSQASLAVTRSSALGGIDMYFFDISNALQGDVINVYGTASSGRGILAVSGVTFDTVIPEPTTATLLTPLAAFLLRRTRR